MIYVVILLIMAVSLMFVYGATAAYRKYKDNQLGESLIETEDNVGDEWMNDPSMLAPSMGVDNPPFRIEVVGTCGFQPEDKRYYSCKRMKGHEGPCAHEFNHDEYGDKMYKPLHVGNKVITLAAAVAQFNTFKNSLVRNGECANHIADGRNWGESCDCEVEAHNAARDMMVAWLTDKETKTSGNQVADPLAHIGRMVKVDRKPKAQTWTPPPVKREQVAILPNELVTFLGNNNLTVEKVIGLAKKQMELDGADKGPLVERIRKNAVDKALTEERAKYVEQLQGLEAKIKAEKEDDAFHLRVVTEEKARLETENEKLKAEIDALKTNQRKADYGYETSVVRESDIQVVDCDGYKVYRTKAGGPVATQTGMRKAKKRKPKKSKRKN